MAFQGTTGVVISIDTYSRSAGTVGAQTVVKAADIESCTFQLPNAKTVRVDGLAEIYEYMIKNGKWMMPDMQMVLRTDITSGAPATGSAYVLVGRPEEAGHPTRSTKIEIASGMSIEWETHQDTVGIDLPKDGVIMSTHNFKHANGTAPTIVGF